MHDETFNQRGQMADWFQNALAGNRFETWFQPVADTSEHRIIGYECLTRVVTRARAVTRIITGAGPAPDQTGAPGQTQLNNPQPRESAEIRSGEQIIAAARAGNQLPLFDSRAMALAVRSAAAQYRHSYAHDKSRPGTFFINVLPALIADPAASMRLAMEALAASRQTSPLRPEDLVFEAVDSDFLGDAVRLRGVHDYVRRQGCGFALDNVGLAGPYCFQTIRDLRPDYVKIDRSLVWNIEQPVCASTVAKLVDVADRYGARVIAVGVERRRMVENLWLLGVQAMQGYLFGRPSPQIARAGKAAESSGAESDLANLARAIENVPRSPASDSQVNHKSPLFSHLN